MKIVIFGATGSVGRYVVEEALSQGHEVIAFARNPLSLNLEHPKLALFAGDVFNYQSVLASLCDCDAALISLGSKKLTGKVRSVGTANIVKAMQHLGVKRLICQTTLGIGDSYACLNFYWKYLMFGFLLRSVFKDHIVQEDIVRQSPLEWTIVRPSAFSDKAINGAIKQGSLLAKENLSLKITRPDVARFMLQQLQDQHYLRQSPGLSY